MNWEKLIDLYENSPGKSKIGEKIGENQSTINKNLREKNEISLRLLEKLSKYFEVPMSYFFDEEAIVDSKTEELHLQLSQLKNAEEKSQQIIEEKNKHISVLEKFQTSLEAQIHDLKKDKERLESENKVLIKNMKDREEIIHKVYDGLIELVSTGRITTKESESLLPQWRLRTLHASDVR